MDTVLIAAAHGTGSAAGLATVRALVDAVRAARPGLTVLEAFLDVAPPTLDEVVRAVGGPAIVVPVLLAGGYHVRTDIPAVLADHPAVTATPPLGPDRALSIALADRLREAGPSPAPTVSAGPLRNSSPTGAIVLAAAGSSDPSVGVDLTRAAADLAAVTGRPVHPAVLSGPGNSLADVRRAHPDQPLEVAAYLIAEGFFVDRLDREARDLGMTPVSRPLGAHPSLVGLILDRFEAEQDRRVNAEWVPAEVL